VIVIRLFTKAGRAATRITPRQQQAEGGQNKQVHTRQNSPHPAYSRRAGILPKEKDFVADRWVARLGSVTATRLFI